MVNAGQNSMRINLKKMNTDKSRSRLFGILNIGILNCRDPVLVKILTIKISKVKIPNKTRPQDPEMVKIPKWSRSQIVKIPNCQDPESQDPESQDPKVKVQHLKILNGQNPK
ncbi:17501_t:CDS:2 [Gigaspora margarita]|uniref:17501_t:CDS:1 n=1 Tax=Gigaspora margarita TaxID=4874 RepID=A0ABN7UN01_GIGMA|nr:17501_t:CDS:2 [Gigaspora margarita]